MTPTKFNREPARPVPLIDLRDYGMHRCAPLIDGNPVLQFWVTDTGVLFPLHR